MKAVADTFRQNLSFDVVDVIKELGVGEALMLFLDPKGRTGVVKRTLICPPTSRLGPATENKRKKVMDASPVAGRYKKEVDRENAFEIMQARADKSAAEAAEKAEAETRRKALEAKEREKAERAAYRGRKGSSRSDSVIETAAKSVARSVARSLGREMVRRLLGMLRR